VVKIAIVAGGAGNSRALRGFGVEVLRRTDRKRGDKTEQQNRYRQPLLVVAHTHSIPAKQVTLPDYSARLPDSRKETGADRFF
jgi:hypothetical protein